MKNVLVMAPNLLSGGGGGQRATSLYCKLISERGLDVRVITRDSKHKQVARENIGMDITLVKIPPRIVGGDSKYSRMVRLPSLLTNSLFRDSMDWADAVYSTGWFSALPFIKKLWAKPIVMHIHSYYPFCPIGILYNTVEEKPCELPKSVRECWRCITKYEKERKNSTMKARLSGILNSTVGKRYSEIVNFADRVIFVSEKQKELSLQHRPSLEARTKVIDNPLPDLDFLPIEGNGLGYFGGTDVIKGPRTLIRAWQNRRETKDRKLYMARMSDKGNRKNPENNNIVFYGDLEEEGLRRVYRKIRAVVVPSVCPEPSPYIVLESLLRGRIVIASRVGGIPEIAGGLKGVFLVNPGEPEKLAGAIERVFSMGEKEVKKLGRKNRKKLLEKFENSKIADRFTKTLQVLD